MPAIPPITVSTCRSSHSGWNPFPLHWHLILDLWLALTNSTQWKKTVWLWCLGLKRPDGFHFHSLGTQLIRGPAQQTEPWVNRMKPFWILQSQRNCPSQYQHGTKMSYPHQNHSMQLCNWKKKWWHASWADIERFLGYTAMLKKKSKMQKTVYSKLSLVFVFAWKMLEEYIRL